MLRSIKDHCIPSNKMGLTKRQNSQTLKKYLSYQVTNRTQSHELNIHPFP